MIDACNNDNIGYAQYGDGSTVYKDRYGLYFALKTGKTMKGVTTPCNCDCSSLVAQCCILSGIPVSIYMSTSNEVKMLENTGEFDEFDFSDNFKLIPGDIMWRNGHTGIIVIGQSKDYDKTPKWVASALEYCNVYQDPSTASSLLTEWPHLGVGNLVDVCDEEDEFWYVRIAGKYFGFVLKKCLSEQPAPEPVFEDCFVMVTADLDLRIQPSSKQPLINIDRNDGKGIRHFLYKDEIVRAVTEENGWCKLKIIGEKYFWYVFVNSQYLKKIDEQEQPMGKATTELNVRTGPGSNYPYCHFDRDDGKGSRHTLKKDEIAPIIQEENGWKQLDLAGKSANWTPWVSAKYFPEKINNF